jgi:hypothetical protein
MAEIVQHPAAPSEPDVSTVSRETLEADAEYVIDEADAEYVIDAEGLAFETRKLIRMLDDEIGRRWMSVELRLQLEEIEIILGDRGFGA